MKITRGFLFLFLLMVTILAAACSSASSTATPVPATPTTPAGAAATPQDAVKNFFVAIYSGQATSALVCSTFSSVDPFVAAAAAARASGSSIDTSGLIFMVKRQTATAATVTVSGQLAFGTTTAAFPSSDVSVVNEGGTWKYCGGAS